MNLAVRLMEGLVVAVLNQIQVLCHGGFGKSHNLISLQFYSEPLMVTAGYYLLCLWSFACRSLFVAFGVLSSVMTKRGKLILTTDY